MQRELLSEAMQRMGLQQHEGLKLGSVLLDTGRGFVTGMASVCEELIQLLGCDVIMLGVVHTNAKAQPFLSLIGRGSARAERSSVDLNKVLARWQGGGHPAAAAASIKLRGPDAVDANAAADVGPLLDLLTLTLTLDLTRTLALDLTLTLARARWARCWTRRRRRRRGRRR